jgi:hypothetical protein
MPPWPPEHGPIRRPSCWVWGLTTLQRWRRQFAGDGGGLDRRKGSHRQCLAASPTRSTNEFCSSATSPSSQSCHRVRSCRRWPIAGCMSARSAASTACSMPTARVPSPWPCPAAPGAPHGAAAEARGPNEDWSWDITYLPTNVRGVWLYL